MGFVTIIVANLHVGWMFLSTTKRPWIKCFLGPVWSKHLALDHSNLWSLGGHVHGNLCWQGSFGRSGCRGRWLIFVLNLPLTLIIKACLNRALAGLCAVRVHILWGWSSFAWWPGMHLLCLYWIPPGVRLFSFDFLWTKIVAYFCSHLSNFPPWLTMWGGKGCNCF